MNLTKLRYQGCHITPDLWAEAGGSPYPRLNFSPVRESFPDPAKKHRLGKLVEEFVFHRLKRQPGISWITDGLQVAKDKITVGELDALYYDHGTPVHLEVAYKFYLYDTLQGHTDPLAYWVGPNRRDNLALKLGKLTQRQFPLLHHPLTRPYLAHYGLEAERIEQRLCFKGQLFVPYGRPQLAVHPLNGACVAGFYLSFSDLAELGGLSFYVPGKLDWLIDPLPGVDWLDYQTAHAVIGRYTDRGRSPLVWLKYPDGRLAKCFVTFW